MLTERSFVWQHGIISFISMLLFVLYLSYVCRCIYILCIPVMCMYYISLVTLYILILLSAIKNWMK